MKELNKLKKEIEFLEFAQKNGLGDKPTAPTYPSHPNVPYPQMKQQIVSNPVSAQELVDLFKTLPVDLDKISLHSESETDGYDEHAGVLFLTYENEEYAEEYEEYQKMLSLSNKKMKEYRKKMDKYEIDFKAYKSKEKQLKKQFLNTQCDFAQPVDWPQK